MSAHKDAVQGAVVLGVAVIGTLLNSTFNALIGMTVHDDFLLFSDCKAILRNFGKSIHAVAIWKNM